VFSQSGTAEDGMFFRNHYARSGTLRHGLRQDQFFLCVSVPLWPFSDSRHLKTMVEGLLTGTTSPVGVSAPVVAFTLKITMLSLF
jgi:hypothetical protein